MITTTPNKDSKHILQTDERQKENNSQSLQNDIFSFAQKKEQKIKKVDLNQETIKTFEALNSNHVPQIDEIKDRQDK